MVLRLTLYFLLVTGSVVAQQKSPVFFEFIQGDSTALFFSKEYTFTEKECADFIRFVRVSETGDLNGYFEDYSATGQLQAKGVYVMGIKHGYFELYHANGKIWSKGYYENNVPVGIWEFFYNTGLRERTLNFENSEILLMRYVDSSGNEKIVDGNGEFEINKLIRPDELLRVRVKGEILNGKPNGKWRALSLNGSSLYTETFDQGKLIKTSLISRKKITPSTPSKLYYFFDGNYLTQLEGFYFSSCDQLNHLYAFDPGLNSKILKWNLTSAIDELIKYDMEHRQTDGYVFGDNYMTVQFSVTKDGKSNDIKLISEWGDRFFAVVKNSINEASFSTKNEKLYFKLRLSYAGGRRYRYTFKFSKHKE